MSLLSSAPRVAAAALVSLVTVAGLAARTAHAQPGLAPPAASPSPDLDERSPVAAFALSLGGTGVSVAALIAGSEPDSGPLFLLGLGGLVVAPSLGHFYAGETRRGWLFTAVRAGSLGGAFVGALMMFPCVDLFSTEEDDDNDAVCTFGAALAIGSLVVGAGSVVIGVIDAPIAASRHNRRVRRLAITPAPIVGPDRSTGAGFILGGSF